MEFSLVLSETVGNEPCILHTAQFSSLGNIRAEVTIHTAVSEPPCMHLEHSIGPCTLTLT
jgi:hypothetical protein